MTLRSFWFVTALCLTTALATLDTAASTATSDAQAVLLAQRALTAVAGTTVLSDAALQGTVTYTAGSDIETGAVTFKGITTNSSSMALTLSGGQRQEIRSGASGAWIGPDGQQHAMVPHNCQTDAAWFYPALTLQNALTDTTVALAYVGQETHEGVAVQHLQISRVVPWTSAEMTTEVQQLSTMDLYLDASTYLPLFLDFNVHPDDNMGMNLPVEIQFSNYQAMNGVQVPSHIQKLLQGSLLLDFTITSAAINTGNTGLSISTSRPN